MSFIDRLSNGWKIAMTSFKILKANKQLVIFPILSGISLLLIFGSFVTILLAGVGWDTDALQQTSRGMDYLFIFLYYLVNYFIVVFFNTTLVHCTHCILKVKK